MVDPKLIDYIKDAISKGYTREEIKKILLENDWTEKEISLALNALEKTTIRTTSREQAQAQKEKHPLETSGLTPLERGRLVTFIKDALNKNITKEEIKAALKWKGWPEYKVDEAFKLTESKEEPPFGKETEGKEEVISLEPERRLTTNLILSYVISFVLISIVIGATISLLFYVIAITNYEVVDPNSGELVKGACLEEKCTDMKRFGFEEVKAKISTSILISSIFAVIIVLTYIFVPFKTALLWIINLLYFIFISYIAYLWIRFNYTLS